MSPSNQLSVGTNCLLSIYSVDPFTNCFSLIYRSCSYRTARSYEANMESVRVWNYSLKLIRHTDTTFRCYCSTRWIYGGKLTATWHLTRALSEKRNLELMAIYETNPQHTVMGYDTQVRMTSVHDQWASGPGGSPASQSKSDGSLPRIQGLASPFLLTRFSFFSPKTYEDYPLLGSILRLVLKFTYIQVMIRIKHKSRNYIKQACLQHIWLYTKKANKCWFG